MITDGGVDEHVREADLADHHGQSTEQRAQRVLELLVVVADDVEAKTEGDPSGRVQGQEFGEVHGHAYDHVDVDAAKGELAKLREKKLELDNFLKLLAYF